MLSPPIADPCDGSSEGAAVGECVVGACVVGKCVVGACVVGDAVVGVAVVLVVITRWTSCASSRSNGGRVRFMRQ